MDELLAKAVEPRPEGAVWHMLGAIQRRRVKALAPVVVCWQTVSRGVEIDGLGAHCANQLAPGFNELRSLRGPQRIWIVSKQPDRAVK